MLQESDDVTGGVPFSVQARSEETGLHYFPTLADALRGVEADPSIWKVSFSLPTGERVRLVRAERLGRPWVLDQMPDWTHKENVTVPHVLQSTEQ